MPERSSHSLKTAVVKFTQLPRGSDENTLQAPLFGALFIFFKIVFLTAL